MDIPPSPRFHQCGEGGTQRRPAINRINSPVSTGAGPGGRSPRECWFRCQCGVYACYIDYLREGDVLVVHSVDRLARSLVSDRMMLYQC